MPCVYLPGPAPAVTVANTSKWHFYCFRELHWCQRHRQKITHRCHWHRQSMYLPVSMTPNDTGVNDTQWHQCQRHPTTPVSTTPNNTGVNDTQRHRCQRNRRCISYRRHWHRWRHASPVSLIPGSKDRQLCRCQWHRRRMSSPVSLTPAMHALPVSLTPVMHQ